MAHVIVEYSANLRTEMDLPRLLGALHASALATGIFPVGGLRTRAYEAEQFCIADGHPDNAFVHVMLRVGHGRDVATRKRACESVFASLCDELSALSERLPLGLSLEMQEIDPVLTMKKNNLHAYVQRRAGSSK